MTEKSSKSDFILSGPIKKVLWKISLPLMLNNFIQTVYNITDSLFITRISSLAVGAVAFMHPLININLALCVALTNAGMALIAQYIGAKQTAKANQTAGQLVIISGGICALVMIFCYLCGPPIFTKLGLSGKMYEYAMQYFNVILLEVPFMFIMNIYNAVRNGQGDTATPMKFTVFSVVLNIALDPLFMFVFNMGIAGAAYATILSRVVVCVPEIILLVNAKDGIKLNAQSMKPNAAVMKTLAKVAVPASVGETVSSCGFMILNFFIIGFSDETMTAFAVGNKILSIFTMPVAGLGSGLAIIIGQHLGSRDIKRAREAIHACMKMGIIASFIAGALIVLSLDLTLPFFISDNALIYSQAKVYLTYLGLCCCFMTIYQIFVGVFQGAAQTKHILFLEMFRLWCVRIPMIFLLSRFTQWAEVSIWVSMSFSNLIIDIAGYIIYKNSKWDKGVFAGSADET